MYHLKSKILTVYLLIVNVKFLLSIQDGFFNHYIDPSAPFLLKLTSLIAVKEV